MGMIKCPVCGKEISDKVERCLYCDSDISVASFTDQQNQNRQTEAYSGDHGTYTYQKNESFDRIKMDNSNRYGYKSGEKTGSNKKMSSGAKVGIIVLVIVLICMFGMGACSLMLVAIRSMSNQGKTISEETDQNENYHDNSIEKGTIFSYMYDENNLYVATAISEKMIKVEHWDKGFSLVNKMSYSSDVGTYKIDDPENEFSWIDDMHTAFLFKLQDKNDYKLSQPKDVVFTISVNTEDTFKGTAYDKTIACYTYVNDDWHMYRAVPLSERLIKIECWSKALSISDYCYAWDWCVIDTDKNEKEFEWADDERTAFVINSHDPSNMTHWKEDSLVSFVLDNSNSKYKTVKDYFDAQKEFSGKVNVESDNTSGIVRNEKNGFDSSKREQYPLGLYTVDIPDYWGKATEVDSGIQMYAETGGKVAMLQLGATEETDDKIDVTFDELMNEKQDIISSLESTVFKKVTDYELLDTGVVKGLIFKGTVGPLGYEGYGEWFVFASEEDRMWCNIVFSQTDNTDFSYTEDYRKILKSIKRADGKPVSKEEIEQGHVDNKTSENNTESDDTTEPEAVEMPIMAGTSIDSAIKKAAEYGLTKSTDYDFGHGTKEVSLSDSSGGLMLDIIYSTSTKEILCATITTINLVSDSQQKKFIKGMAGILCPEDDSKEVSDWVSGNVGKNNKTTIGGITYEVSLGPAENNLYYAGYSNWEEWDLSHN